ncbi:MAG: hypothetical protein V3T23_13785 [Nitrososphaerales archaeon]
MNKEIEVEFTYEELVKAFILLRPLGESKLPVVAAIKVRDIHYALKPKITARTEVQDGILTEHGALKDNTGWKIKDGDIQFKTKAGETKALRELKKLTESKVKIKMIPLRRKDLIGAKNLYIEPSLLISLEDSKLLVLD